MVPPLFIMLELFDPYNPPRVYVHIPFCQYKCAYCGFYSVACGLSTDTSGYFRRLLSESQVIVKYFKKPFKSVYIGGGTPNLRMNFQYIKDIIEVFSGSDELNVECNVSSLDENQLEFFCKNVTRLSVGVQSFDKATRDNLCRFEALDNIKTLFEFRKNCVNFPVLNLDFITGASEDDEFSKGFSSFVQYCDDNSYNLPEHISLYALTVEDNSTYKRLVESGRRSAVKDDRMAEILKANWKVLESFGYEHYEVSAFARDKKYCSHNMNYWALGDYIGIGAGAASRAFFKEPCEIKFEDNWQSYSHGSVDFSGYKIEKMSKKDVALELILTGLRTKFGINIDDFNSRTDFNLLSFISLDEGFVVEDGALKIPATDFIMCESYIKSLAFKVLDEVL